MSPQPNESRADLLEKVGSAESKASSAESRAASAEARAAEAEARVAVAEQAVAGFKELLLSMVANLNNRMDRSDLATKEQMGALNSKVDKTNETVTKVDKALKKYVGWGTGALAVAAIVFPEVMRHFWPH